MSNYTAYQGQRSASSTSLTDYRRNATLHMEPNGSVSKNKTGNTDTCPCKHLPAHTCNEILRYFGQRGLGTEADSLNPACLLETESLCLYSAPSQRSLSAEVTPRSRKDVLSIMGILNVKSLLLHVQILPLFSASNGLYRESAFMFFFYLNIIYLTDFFLDGASHQANPLEQTLVLMARLFSLMLELLIWM